ncbi:dual specificity phosphatase [Scheffersomyces xylosifermentans]|uniref:dual specificity phosphatase n=1 Tax=Scheffersomyces xylosifermentans TaxID=1304137 RepID=UPI00315C5194
MNPFVITPTDPREDPISPKIATSTTMSLESPSPPRYHQDFATSRASSFNIVASSTITTTTTSITNSSTASNVTTTTNNNSTNSMTSLRQLPSYRNEHYNTYSDASLGFPPTAISDPSSTSPSANGSPLIGMINYSPRHSRKRSSLTSNRNMKNLSLNLTGNHSTSSSLDSTSSTYTYNASPSQQLPFNKPPSLSSRRSLSLTKSLSDDGSSLGSVHNINNSSASINSNNNGSNSITNTINNSSTSAFNINLHNNSNSSSVQTTTVFHVQSSSNPMFTPAVTKTPALPPLMPKPKLGSSSDSEDTRAAGIPFKFPPREIDYFGRNKSPLQDDTTKLRSPLVLNGAAVKADTIESELATVTLKELAKDDLDAFYPLPPPRPASSHCWNKSPHNYKSEESSIRQLIIPEELQESNQLDAYPDGPRDVFNGQIFLYSDPASSGSTVDINNFDLVINVAKECVDLSRQYVGKTPGQGEYLYVPWSHTSPISKDLLAITTKIESYISRGLRVLVHCQCGVSRSACVIVAYFMLKFKIGVNVAYELLKSGTANVNETMNKLIGDQGNRIEACDRICPNMSLIFELMEFNDMLDQKY